MSRRVVLALLLSALSGPVFAAEPPASSPPRSVAEMEARLLAMGGGATAAQVEKARIDEETARIRLESQELDRRSGEATVAGLETKLKEVEKSLIDVRANPSLDEAARSEQRDRLIAARQQMTAELERERQRLDELTAQGRQLREAMEAAREWRQRLEEAQRRSVERSRREALEDVVARLKQEEARQLTLAEESRARLAGGGELTDEERTRLRLVIQEAEERARLRRYELRLARVEVELEGFEPKAGTSDDEVRAAQGRVAQLAAELETSSSLLRDKREVIIQQVGLLEKRRLLESPRSRRVGEDEQRLTALAAEMEKTLKSFAAPLKQVAELRARLQSRITVHARRDLFAQHRFAGGGEDLRQLREVPAAMGGYLRTIGETLLSGAAAIDAGRWLLLLAGLGGVFLAARRGRRWMAAHPLEEPGPRTTVALMRELGHSLLLPAAVSAGLLILCWGFQLPLPQLAFVATVVGLWLGTLIALSLAKGFLRNRQGHMALRYPRLIRPLRALLYLALTLVSLVLLAHWSGIAVERLDLLDRGLFLLLLPVLPALMFMRRVLDGGIAEAFGGRFWTPAARFMVSLPIFSVIGALVLGAIGYVNLARAMVQGISWLVVAAGGWLLMVGLTRDTANALKNYALRRASYGLLWTQGIIEPLRKLSNVLLFIAAVAWLFNVYGWDADSTAMRALKGFLDYPLFTVGEAEIRIKGLLKGVILTLFVIWLARWVREITFRWLYVSVTDLGIRQSLATFTQYAALTLGLMLALNTLGIDITALAVFAGAVGVGLGLGLQNIANNFISGLLLLAERPLKTGDYVTIAGQEGEVTRFGIRSLTIKTWDNQETVIPNAEVIANAFTNWTYSDSLMRTYFYIGVAYESEMERVRELLAGVLAAHPAVVKEPPYRVWLWEFADSSVNFRVQYFTDLRQTSRMEVRDQVLFAIWNTLKENGISIPFPQRDLNIKGWSGPAPSGMDPGSDQGAGRAGPDQI